MHLIAKRLHEVISGGDQIIDFKKVRSGGDGHLRAAAEQVGAFSNRAQRVVVVDALPVPTARGTPSAAMRVFGARRTHAVVRQINGKNRVPRVGQKVGNAVCQFRTRVDAVPEQNHRDV